MISNNYNNYNNQMNNVSYGAVKDIVPANINQKLPENIQNLDAVEIANNNGAISSASGADSKTLIATIPFYLGLIGLRTINDNPTSKFSMAGQYDKSVFGKFGKLGDRIHAWVSKIIPDGIETKMANRAKSVKNWVLDHSAIARSTTTPLKLESQIARSEASGLFSRVMHDNADLIQKGGSKIKLSKYFSKTKTPELYKLLEQKGFAGQTGKEAASTVADVLRDVANMGKTKDSLKYADEIAKVFENVDERAIISKWGKLPVGKIPILGKLLTLNAPLSEISNKTKVAMGLGGATALGKGFASGFAKAYEGLTSNVAGGKIAPMMEAFFLAQALMRAKDAPKGQKLATFMDEEVAGVATLFTMPLATSIMTKMGGLKYLGMGKTVAEQTQNVDKFRNMVKALNDRVDAKTITRGEYLDEVKKIKDLLNCKGADGKSTLKFWQKPFKAIGKLLGSNYKAETIKPFIDDAIPKNASKLKAFGLNVSNKVQKASYGLKTGKFLGMTPGGIGRFILAMFVLSPIVSKPIRWVTNKIFGKPYDPEKEKEEAAKKAKEEAMKNNPFTKMSDQELMDLLSKNQDTMIQIQNNPELMQQLQTNPQMLYDMLQQGAKQKDEALKNAGPSPMLQKYLNQRNANPQYANPQAIQPSNGFNQGGMQQTMSINGNGLNQNSTMNFNTNATMPKPQIQDTKPAPANNDFVEPKRTYIPSSKPADFSQAQQIQDAKLNAILADMEKTEKEYSKYIGI